MLNKFVCLKCLTTFFLVYVKTARFLVPLIVLGKWKVFAEVKIHRKRFQGAQIRRARRAEKARTARGRVRHEDT